MSYAFNTNKEKSKIQKTAPVATQIEIPFCV